MALQVPHRQWRLTVASRGLVRRAHRAGLQVHVWTIDDPAEMHRLMVNMWALNATLLLIGLAGGAVPWMKSRQIRALIGEHQLGTESLTGVGMRLADESP